MAGLVMHRAVLSAAGVLAGFGALGAQRADGCVSGAGDPLCVEPGRYRAMPELVVDLQHQDRVWQRRVSERMSQPDAVRYCANLSVGGMRGFRLPTPDELGSLRYKPGGLFGGGRHYCVPTIDQDAFPETPAAEFWTSRVAGDGTAWYVDFSDGRRHKDVMSDSLWVRCVAPSAAPSGR
jgi:hypothetical protein